MQDRVATRAVGFVLHHCLDVVFIPGMDQTGGGQAVFPQKLKVKLHRSHGEGLSEWSDPMTRIREKIRMGTGTDL